MSQNDYLSNNRSFLITQSLVDLRSKLYAPHNESASRNVTNQRADRQITIHVAGALHVDEVATMRNACSPQASNPVSWIRSVGGVGGNAARAAQKVLSQMKCGRLCLHASVGVDHAAQQLIEAMQTQGLNVAAQPVSDCQTGRYSAIVDQTGELLLGLADVQLAEQLDAVPITSTLYQDGMDALLLDANLSPDCLRELITTATQTSTLLAAMTVSPGKASRLLPLARQIPLLYCNRREAIALAFESGLIQDVDGNAGLSLSRLMSMLIEMGFNDCVLTDGSDPLLIRYKGAISKLLIPSVTIVQNVNGAGDALAGASFAAMVAGCSLPEAVRVYGLENAASVLGGSAQLALTVNSVR